MIAVLIIGWIVAAVGGIWILVKAFQESVLWGLGSLLLPVVSLVYVIMHWEDAKKPFLIQVGGIILMVIGMVATGASAA